MVATSSSLADGLVEIAEAFLAAKEQRDQAGEPADRGRVRVYEPEDWADRIRQYYDQHTARPTRPVLVPIPV